MQKGSEVPGPTAPRNLKTVNQVTADSEQVSQVTGEVDNLLGTQGGAV